MKALLWIAGAAIIIIIGFYALNGYIYNEKQGDPSMSSSTPSSVEIVPISHASLILKYPGTSIYVDPTGSSSAYSGQPAADFVLLTDIHGDHFSTTTLAAIVNQDTTLVVPQAVKDILPTEIASNTAEVLVLKNGESSSGAGMTITAMPMYNLPGSSNANFHTKGRGNGYIVEAEGKRIYIAGDTAGTPEMKALTDIDVAFIPMNLPYTMSVEEAAEAVLAFKPKQVYPYHYRGADGLADVAKFKTLVNAGDPNIEVVLAKWY